MSNYRERLAKIVEGQSDEHLHFQVALMAMENENELMAIYSFFRSNMGGDIPLQIASNNIRQLFEKNNLDYDSIKNTPNIKLRKKFCIQFVRMVAILSNFPSLEKFDEVWCSVAGCIEEFLTSKSTTDLDVLQVISIMIYIVHFHNKLHVGVGVGLDDLLLHKYALLTTFEIVRRMMQICVSANDVFSTSLLPALLVFMEWFVYSRDMIKEEVEINSYVSNVINDDVEERLARARWFFWTSCERFVNNFSARNNMQGQDGIFSFYKNNGELVDLVALWEDSALQGFVPMDPVHRALKLSKPKVFRGYDREQENMNRMARIMDAAGKAVWIHEALQSEEKKYKISENIRRPYIHSYPREQKASPSTDY